MTSVLSSPGQVLFQPLVHFLRPLSVVGQLQCDDIEVVISIQVLGEAGVHRLWRLVCRDRVRGFGQFCPIRLLDLGNDVGTGSLFI